MNTILSLNNLNKTYEGGFEALKDINLEIRRGEIFALLGPNGAGKTTLINSVCGLVMPTSGQIHFDGKDIAGDFRYARERIGLVPQELCTDAFETPWDTVHFSRGLFGKPRDGAYVEQVLRNLSLWDKRKNMIRTLSGGMKRRVMIAKALSHEPQLLFLDEPTAGVDVELRKGMWDQVRALQKTGVTIILTTHYIDEAEEMADRIGIISQGELILVDRKEDLIKKLGRKEMILDLLEPLQDLPAGLSRFDLTLSDDRRRLSYTFDSAAEDNGIAQLLSGLLKAGYECRDINTKQSSLEEIFISLVNKK
ncbi:MAG: ABC transporter ATP-binding protein [Candidatus Omnitrophica bacterium]|nr:ABC transporter ATP-binding protein [Candidatus Omnitrophota bacterium]MCB9722268.1 ABC transporter ATP-binding protein [Candidatus Omnitrophota bacterium]